MTVVTIDTTEITDWNSFHDVFAQALGFPSFYGRNMNAWIDCMTSLDDPNAGTSKVTVPPGQVLTLQLAHIDDFVTRCPELYAAVTECAAFVNYRRIEQGECTVLALSYFRTR